jgi:hypothetical protein
MVRAGVAEEVAMTVFGHRTRSIFDRYHIISPSDIRGASRKLEVNRAQGGEEKAALERARALQFGQPPLCQPRVSQSTNCPHRQSLSLTSSLSKSDDEILAARQYTSAGMKSDCKTARSAQFRVAAPRSIQTEIHRIDFLPPGLVPPVPE